MSRFSVAKVASIAPGCCLICRGHEGPFIDCGFNHQFDNTIPPEWDGAVYICQTCVSVMQGVLELSSTVVEQRIQNAYTEGMAEGVRRGKRKLDEFVNSFVDNDMLTGRYAGKRASVPVADDAGDEPRKPRNAKGAGKTREQNVSADRGQGPDGVPSDRDDGSVDSSGAADGTDIFAL